MIFDELKIKVNSVIDRLDEIMVEAMVTNKEEIIDLNVSQLEQGIGSDGLAMTPDYASADYAGFKQSIGSKAPLGTPDLKVTGEFHEGFYAEEFISGTEGMSGLFIDSKSELSEKLEKKYTKTFGISPESNLGELLIDNGQKIIVDEITR